jgi:hypothetical protein
MNIITHSDRKNGKRLITFALFSAVVLAGAFIASGIKSGTQPPGWFQQVESGINHASMPCDSHHICAVGMNSLLGHCTTTIALTAANRGIIEYQSQAHGGDALYGVVNLTTNSASGLTTLSITITRGTGRYEGVYGVANGTMRYLSGAMNVQSYSATVTGVLKWGAE